MADENTPEKPPGLDEQTEAVLAAAIAKSGDADISQEIAYKTRLDLYNALLEAGVPKEVVLQIVGKLLIRLPEHAYGKEIYQATLESASKRFAKLYEACVRDMSAQVFIDIVDGLAFVVPC